MSGTSEGVHGITYRQAVGTAGTTTTEMKIPNNPPFLSYCLFGYNPNCSVLLISVRTRMSMVRFVPVLYQPVNGIFLSLPPSTQMFSYCCCFRLHSSYSTVVLIVTFINQYTKKLYHYTTLALPTFCWKKSHILFARSGITTALLN